MATTLRERYGRIRQNFSVIALVEADGASAKPPTEVQTLKKDQKAGDILHKQMNADDLAAAARRDLDTKSAEERAKITAVK